MDDFKLSEKYRRDSRVLTQLHQNFDINRFTFNQKKWVNPLVKDSKV